MPPSPYKVGQVVSIDDGRTGTIKFIGPTAFRDGEWIGIELADDSGKNDGSVQGQRYFDCEDGHGLFLQAPKIEKVLEQPKPAAKKPVARPSSISSKPGPSTSTATSTAAKRQSVVSNGLKRTSMADPTAAKRQTMNAASPTPSRTTATSRASAKPAAKPSTAASSTAASRTGTPSTAARRTQTSSLATSRAGSSASPSKPTTTTTRPSLAAPRPTRTSVASGSTSTATSTRTSANRSSISSRAAARPSSTASAGSTANERPVSAEQGSPSKVEDKEEDKREEDIEEQDEEAENNDRQREGTGETQVEENADGEPLNGHAKEPAKEKSAEAPPKAQTISSKAPAKPTPKGKAPAAPSPAAAAARSKREEELTKAIELLERKRAEDKEKLSRFEKVMAEKDRYASVIEKLQSKYQPQTKDLQEKTQRVETLEKRLAELEETQEEHDAALEEAALDRETAEEIAETLRTELDELKVRAEELEFEVETLRDENDELGKEMSPEERTSKGWLQMERENQRLRDALLRLRDMTKEQEAELKEEVERLETDLKEFQSLKSEYEETKQRLQQSESDLNELKEQLEAAREGEGMLEELTDKNLALNEEMEELRLSIEHLENIRDLNDEMELAHVENERQMQEELDTRDALVAEHIKHVAQQDERLTSYEYTINKFRELVTNLQNHIEEMKSTKQISEAESEELSNRSKAMADLNLRLQNSAMKAQVKTVDFELSRLEAQEAVEHLGIVSMFLLDGYQMDKDSVLAYLRFKRIQFKAELLQGFFKEKQAEALTAPISDNTFTLCDITDSFAWIAGTANRFVCHISACTSEQFSKYSSALHELDPIEKGLNRYVEAWKKGDYKERNIAEELKRSILLLTHLAEVHIDENPSSFAEDVLMRTNMMQTELDNASVALTLIFKLIEGRKKLIPDDADESEIASFDEILKLIESSLAHTRTAKFAAGKAFNAVQELRDRSMALDTETLDLFEKPQKHVFDILQFTKSMGEQFYEAFENQDKEGASPQSVIDSSISYLKTLPLIDRQDRSPLLVLNARLQGSTEHLNKLISTTSELSNASEFQRADPPWIVRGETLKSTKKTAASAEEENKRLKDDIKERLTQLRMRDQQLEEQIVKIELLESRMKEANAKANRIYELQTLVDTSKKREKELTTAIEGQLRVAQNLQAERDRWKQVADENKAASTRDAKRASGDRAGGSAKEMEILRRQIRSLQGAVRYLRDEGRRDHVKVPTNSANIDWLTQPLFASKLPAVKAQRDAHDVLLQEGNVVLESLVDLVTNAQSVDLRKLPENKLAWCPAKDKSAWAAARQAEQWQTWCSSRDSYISKVRNTLASMPKTLNLQMPVQPFEGGIASVETAHIPGAPPSIADEFYEDARSEVVGEA